MERILPRRKGRRDRLRRRARRPDSSPGARGRASSPATIGRAAQRRPGRRDSPGTGPPSKFVCVGLNYQDHAAEMAKPLPAEPMLFFKPSTAVLDPDAPILLPPGVGRVDHEAELAVVIGRRAHRVSRARPGTTSSASPAVNDVTARDMQNRESSTRAARASIRSRRSAPASPTPRTVAPRMVEGWVNGERRQPSTTAQLIFPIDFSSNSSAS